MASKKNKSSDITQSGPLTYRDLQRQNNTGYTPTEEDKKFLASYFNSRVSKNDPSVIAPGYAQSSLIDTATPWGSSLFDEKFATDYDFENLDDTRARNQPWIAKLGAGLLKGVGLAGTTFLDGTVGLIYGITQMRDKGFSALWDNEVSNGLQEFNRAMEEWLPNYRTQKEQVGPWYKNLGTINFWADSFLKNMGFTVGALYSGNVFAKGLQWAGRGLELIGSLGKLVKPIESLGIAMQQNGLGAKLTGSLFSAINEGRIEANNTVHDVGELRAKQLEDAHERALKDIEKLPFKEQEAARKQVDENFKLAAKQLDDDLKKIGLTTLAWNIPILAFDNFWTFGKMYAQGFQNAKDVAKSNVKKGVIQRTKDFFSRASKAANEAADAAEDAIVQGVKKNGADYTWDTITRKKALAKGAFTGILEGNEELAQAWASEYAGNVHGYKDTPDTYYRAMTDPEALKETQDGLAAAATAFFNTYGNMDRYEEFAIGALTGLLGTPTFGKKQNSSSNTYLGRGKFLGLSGGIGGELSVAKEMNRLGQQHVEAMNTLVDKINKHKGILAASKKFTDAMEGWVEADDKFEYKNQEDNEDWMGISSFLSTGRKQDLLALIDQDFENSSDEELAAIAAFTSVKGSDVKSGGWRDASGNIITADSSKEDKNAMRKKLADKRDEIKEKIKSYEKSLNLVRNLVSGSNEVSEDEILEMAWLHWKMGRFNERYNSIIEKNKTHYSKIDGGLADLEKQLDIETDPDYDEDEDEDAEPISNDLLRAYHAAERAESQRQTANAEDLLKKIKELRRFFNTILGAKGQGQIGAGMLINAQMAVLDGLMNDDELYKAYIAGYLSKEEYRQALKDLKDLGKLTKAYLDFNDRFSEFRENPRKQKENRQKIDAENAEKQKVVEESTKRKEARQAATDRNSVKKMDDDELQAAYDSLDGNNPNDAERRKKLKAEMDLRKKAEAVRRKLKSSLEDAETENDSEKFAAVQEALKRMEGTAREADDDEEFADLGNEIWNSEEGDSLSDEALSQLAAAMDKAEKESSAASNMRADGKDDDTEDDEEEEEDNAPIQPTPSSNPPSNPPSSSSGTPTNTNPPSNPTGTDTSTNTNPPATPAEKASGESKSTGHDSVDSTPPVNGQRAANPPTEPQRKKTAGELAEEAQEIIKATATILLSKFPEINALPDGHYAKQALFDVLVDFASRVYAHLQQTEDKKEVLDTLLKEDEWKTLKEMLKEVKGIEAMIPYAIDFMQTLIKDTEVEKKGGKDYSKTVGIPTQFPKTYNAEEDYDEEALNTMLGIPSKVYGTWFSIISEYPIHGSSILPYVKSDTFERVLKSKYSSQGLSGKALTDAIEAEKKRITAIYDYLKAHNAFSNAAKVKEKTKIYFIIDPTLNEVAGEVTILLSTDKEGKNIVGALKGKNETTRSEQIGLTEFIERLEKSYQEAVDAGHSGIWAHSKFTHVNQAKVGRVMFSDTTHSLNEIFTVGSEDNKKVTPFVLGVYMPDKAVVTSARTNNVNSTRTETEKKARKPRKALPGQPFLLIPTGKGVDKYVPVSFHMDLYSDKMKGTKFDSWVIETIEKVFNRKSYNINTKKGQLELKDALADLFTIYGGTDDGGFRISTKDGTLVITAVMQDGNPKTIFTGPAKKPDVNALVDALRKAGLGIQVNRKYINDTIILNGKKVNYNEVIGEIAHTNMHPGITTTVNDWFTLNPLDADDVETLGEKIPNAADKGTTKASNVTKTQVTVEGKIYKVQSDGVITDAAGTKLDITDNKLLNKIKAAAEIKTNEIVSVNSLNPTVYRTYYGLYDTETSKFISDKDLKTAEESPTEPKSVPNTGSIDANISKLKAGEDAVVGETYTENSKGERRKLYVFAKKDNNGYEVEFRKDKNIPFGTGILSGFDMLDIVGYDNSLGGTFLNTEDISDENSPYANISKAKGIHIIKFFQNEHTGNRIAVQFRYNDNGQIVEGTTLLKEGIGIGELISLHEQMLERLKSDKPTDTSKKKEDDTIDDTIDEGDIVDDDSTDDSLASEIRVLSEDTSEDKSVIKKYSFSPSTPKEPTEAPKDSKAKDGGSTTTEATMPKCCNTAKLKEVWSALTVEQQAAINKMTSAKQRQIIDRLKTVWKNNKFTKDVNDIISPPKHRKVTKKSQSREEQIQKELEWVKKALPQLDEEDRIRLVDGLIKVANSETPSYAWGKFQNGIITLSKIAAKGTAYHEAFHFVSQTLLTGEELDALYEEGKSKYKITDLDEIEENLAEDFRKYMQIERMPFIGKAVKVFRILKHNIQSLLGNESIINNMFYRISRGELANRTPRTSTETKYQREQYTAEEQEILNNAPRDSEGRLLAPNGKPSNLTERQYAQVRTKAFKEWFGDWENDPKNSSKVVDENGEPLVVYHGTDEKFTTFDYSKYGTKHDEGVYGRGHYFTSKKDAANHYAGGKLVYETFLNIRNPYSGNLEYAELLNREMSTEQLADYFEEAIIDQGETRTDFIKKLGNLDNADGVIVNSADTKFDEIVVFNSNQIKSATDNVGTFSRDNDDIRYRLVDNSEEVLRVETQRFLDNFDITLKEVEEYNGETPLFDAINRVINFKNAEDITEGVGYAVAFMMQHTPQMADLLAQYLLQQSPTRFKGFRRYLRRTGDIQALTDKMSKQGENIWKGISSEAKDTILKEIGTVIASELRSLYTVSSDDVKQETFLQKVQRLIMEFFDMMTHRVRTRFNVVYNYPRSIANSIKLNDPSFIIQDMIKPGSSSEATRVAIDKAFKDNPYEDAIIRKLQKHNIALAGSTSIALAGTVYRPAENPLHDIDFVAAEHTRESLDKIVSELSPYNEHIRVIRDSPTKATETYLIMDRPFTIKKGFTIKEEGKKKTIYYINDKQGNRIGKFINNDLILEEGVTGKFLDFFTGSDSKMLDFKVTKIGDWSYLMADYREAMAAKLRYSRPKDIWDYNRFVSNETAERRQRDKESQRRVLREKVSKARVIWGHPAIGKTTYLETHDDIIEWDDLVNPKINLFFREQLDPDHKMDVNSSEYRALITKYMEEWREHPEYVEFLTREWNALLERAKRENKRVFASPLALLEIGANDIDLAVAIDQRAFMERNQKRGGTLYDSLDWKQNIDEYLIGLGTDRVVYTDMYFSEFMEMANSHFGELSRDVSEAIADRNSLAYNSLNSSRRTLLRDLGVSEMDYEQMTEYEKRELWRCKA